MSRDSVPGLYVRDGRYIVGFRCPQTGRWRMETLDADLVRLGTRTGGRRARAPPMDGSSCRIPQSTRRPALTATAARIDAAVVIPDSELALHALVVKNDRFPRGIAVGVPSAETGGRATDKAVLMRTALSAGLVVPSTTIVTRDELKGNGLHVRVPDGRRARPDADARREGLARARGRTPRDQFF